MLVGDDQHGEDTPDSPDLASIVRFHRYRVLLSRAGSRFGALCSFSTWASGWYGHPTNIASTKAAIENSAAEVESISSDTETIHLQKEIDTRNMNSTTGIDAAVSQVQTAQQFQTTFEC